MSAENIKDELHQLIENADEQSLRIVLGVLKSEETEADYALSSEHKELLDNRLDEHEKNPTSGSSWQEVRKRIEKRI
ncbi:MULTISPECIES: addiction module protein [unclassified Imperialibacter]|uniref:addiction module protein n=1 Tax=unclassified Imperialibacter TaxID=2629706 RepID=UPI001254151A|nr:MULTISPECIES: addiction module protein [unclassified Imperialibacter]CAD5274570.1 conserved hypothetical protein [Imperialibacter sp. 75]CAD5288248.1 conserved hypothetical protein [Imperialibacter sp. 89]VVT35600.1 conserved hypothetical protein [Imperialibacter sp. EC-SDR9]